MYLNELGRVPTCSSEESESWTRPHGQAVQLSFSELKVHFGVPLTEAAAILGVQRQDLVRSCR